jgi:hypothetical protein
MKPKAKIILLITSFIPVIVFKVIARVGDATPAQAKLAAIVGLILAAVQFTLSKKLINHTTYLEKAFLGFLGIGTVWVFLAPSHVSSIFVEGSTALLYFLLFLTTLIPQLFGYDPFTYAIAKQMVPEQVWNTPQFTSHLFLEFYLLCWISFMLVGAWKAPLLNHSAVNTRFRYWPPGCQNLSEVLPQEKVCGQVY